VMTEAAVPAHISSVGAHLLAGLRSLASRHEALVSRAVGLPEMCYLEFRDEPLSGRAAVACAERGLLFKRGAYNFPSLAHDEAVVDRTLEILDDALSAVGRRTA
jgi:4-aminobutyrate aminotransferase-like enzyme